jgi:hypothetical protein
LHFLHLSGDRSWFGDRNGTLMGIV